MDYLFVYGTLMKTVNNGMSCFLHYNAEFIGNAYILGKLYDLDGFPGAIVSDNPSERVYGNIFKIKDTQTVFKVLDDYEGIGAGPPDDYEFVRDQVIAYLEDGTEINTWFYAYNLPTDTLKLIPSGRYFK
ncbi:gamma-glutamylcyclotransferase family protein [Confluentibacter flavum]|uniref:Gamma-glutamylcyclotransferase n=1 Tax=Confluentibacter flavum TaxID=1909700 RepID=A0A2N3HMS7_9FLAO|nr:gamma-glutamylcyclotransferase family protein [Confluentibacter flavum]PKQ46237.1 gamma-glutamylcyclotransferase [Confluentibacter flavum]